MTRIALIALLTVTLPYTFVSNLVAMPQTYTENLDFYAKQSLWGKGGYSDFDYSGNFGGSVGIDYEVKASTGTVTTEYNGVFSVNYNDYLERRGTTELSLTFRGDANGGLLDTYLGASVDIGWFVDFEIPLPWPLDDVPVTGSGTLYKKSYELDIDKTFTPMLGSTVHESDAFTAAKVGTSGVIGIGVDLDIEQEAEFTADSIDAVMVYQHRETGVVGTTPFSLDVDDYPFLEQHVNLTKGGYWDFYFGSWVVGNTFSTEFDLSINPYVEIDIGIWDKRWRWSLLGFNFYDNSFPLEFDLRSGTIGPAFSIFVAPEPDSSWLLMLGLLLLCGNLARSRKKD